MTDGRRPPARRSVDLRVSIGPALVAVVIVLGVVVASPLGLGRVDAQHAVHALATDGPFRLDFTLSSSTYRTTDSIEGQATLSVTDGRNRALYGGGGIIIFSYAEVGGTRHMDGSRTLLCGRFTLQAAHPLTQVLTVSGGWDPADPNAAFYRVFFADPQIQLPAGTWEITALATFSEGEALGCGSTKHDITATIRLTVTPGDRPLR